MDSDEEAAEEEPVEGEGRAPAEQHPGEAEASGEEQEAGEEAVSSESLDEVHSFGRMMLLASALRSRLGGGGLGPVDLAAACRALARTKYFDKELLDDLYVALRSALNGSHMTASQTSDALHCLRALNAYDREVCSAIARSFSGRAGELEPRMRCEWLEALRAFRHGSEPGFLQKLEVPPVAPHHPYYKKVRCWHDSRGGCVLEGSCTFSHDPRAPLSLADGTKEDWWKIKSSLMMTQNQKTLGQGSYGTGPLGVNPA